MSRPDQQATLATLSLLNPFNLGKMLFSLGVSLKPLARYAQDATEEKRNTTAPA